MTTSHSFTIDTVWCEDHNCFEPMLSVLTVDTKTFHKETPPRVRYPLHDGGLAQLFLNIANHVGGMIPTNPASTV